MGDTKEELEQNIRLILARLDKYELKIAIHKCDFDCNSSIEFLGHTICDGKISPGPKSSKILEGIVFIGIANWFAKYIPDCQRRLRPLLDARIDGWHDASKDGYFCVLFEDTGIGDACDRWLGRSSRKRCMPSTKRTWRFKYSPGCRISIAASAAPELRRLAISIHGISP